MPCLLLRERRPAWAWSRTNPYDSQACKHKTFRVCSILTSHSLKSTSPITDSVSRLRGPQTCNAPAKSKQYCSFAHWPPPVHAPWFCLVIESTNKRLSSALTTIILGKSERGFHATRPRQSTYEVCVRLLHRTSPISSTKCQNLTSDLALPFICPASSDESCCQSH